MAFTAPLRVGLFWTALVALGAPGRALGPGPAIGPPQGGYDVQRHPTEGLEFPVPRRWGTTPIQPGERWIRFVFSENREETIRRGRRSRPFLWVVEIPWVPDPPAVTNGGAASRPAPPPGEEDDGGGGAKDDAREPPRGNEAEQLPLNSLERFLERRMPQWWVSREGETRTTRGIEGRELFLEHKNSAKTGRVAWVWSWRARGEREVLLVGFCHRDDLDELSDIWRTIAKRTRLIKKDLRERDRLERYYARKHLPHPEYRIRVRLALPPEWEAEDTQHYIVVYHTKDQPLIRKIVSDIENIREAYVERFPPAGEVDAVSTIRVCADRDEYLLYSGLPGSAGYWNPSTEELVLYDATKREKGKRTDKTDTFIILYHEAFHQYIHYSAGELAPHSWFNEGYGDYFSGARIKGGRIRKIGPNPWRVGVILAAVSKRQHIPWEQIVRYEQRDYYRRARLCYAQGWSMIYFLEESKVVRKHPTWSKILTTYFETLQRVWAEQQERLAENGEEEDADALAAAQLQARAAAVDAAFRDVDLRALEEEWIRFVEGLEDGR